jgi:hypothetical protein
VRGDVSVDSETLLMTDFVNLKIKLTQSFRDAYTSRMYIHVFIWLSDHKCMNICVCTVFLKNINLAFIYVTFSKEKTQNLVHVREELYVNP